MTPIISGVNATFEKSFIVKPRSARRQSIRASAQNESNKIRFCSGFWNIFHNPAFYPVSLRTSRYAPIADRRFALAC